MRQTRWQPFSPIWNQVQQLQTEMSRLFDRCGDGGGWRGFAATYPAVNVWEDAENVFVEAELPGLDPKDLEIPICVNTGDEAIALLREHFERWRTR